MQELTHNTGKQEIRQSKKGLLRDLKMQWPMHLMIIPGITAVVLFSYLPMAGIRIAFMDFKPLLGLEDSPYIGLENFRYIMTLPNFWRVIYNTLFISIAKIILGLIASVILALLINELPSIRYRKAVQTITCLPHFISWVIMGGLIIDLFSLDGLANKLRELLNLEPILFLGDKDAFPWLIIWSDVWKGVGFSSIVFLAALASIDPDLYEAAAIDGAGPLRRAWHISIAGLASTIILVGTLSLGSILSAGFEQILVLYGPSVYETGDVLDTFVYRLGLIEAQYGPAAAAGLFKSLVSLVLILISYYLAYRYAEYRIF